MNSIVECVPNFSEGRRPEVVDAIVNAILSAGGVVLLDREMDADHNRCVITIVGPKDKIGEAAFRGVAKAAELIDLTTHQGEHPRLGAADVVPFIPVKNASVEECVRLAEILGERIWNELKIPVYLYEEAARSPERKNLEKIRKGQFEGIREEVKTNPDRRPDFGEAALHPTAGATVVGARKFLIAYNVNLATSDVGIAKDIAKKIRASGGGLPCVKGMGVMLGERNIAQVSMNLTDYETTSMATVFEAVEKEAKERGTDVVGSEIVGLVPARALEDAAEHFLRVENFSSDLILENRLAAVASDRAQTHAEQCAAFLDALAAKSPTPGGGCAAALAIAMGASLGLMCVRATRGKKRYADYENDLAAAEEKLSGLAGTARTAIDDDARAFQGILAAMNRPKETDEQRAARGAAIEQATIHAAEVPLADARLGMTILRTLRGITGFINVNAASDLKVGEMLCEAGIRGALENVHINLASINDEEASERLGKAASELIKELN
ncbi:MAG: glutamate formimidoyltransferase [Deltaproteobacteria bacterium]|nr:glutamate formimidoyltransferase [Deltaproteobacteria bacterium]